VRGRPYLAEIIEQLRIGAQQALEALAIAWPSVVKPNIGGRCVLHDPLVFCNQFFFSDGNHAPPFLPILSDGNYCLP
jgi:hypothetical protein